MDHSERQLRRAARDEGFHAKNLPLRNLTNFERVRLREYLSARRRNRALGFLIHRTSGRMRSSKYSGKYTFTIGLDAEERHILRRDTIFSMSQDLVRAIELIRANVISLEFLRDTDKIQFGFSDGDNLFYTTMEQVSILTAEAVINRFLERLDSDESFNFARTVVTVLFSKDLRGSGYPFCKGAEDFIKSKRCIRRVMTRGVRHDCFLQSLAISMARFEESMMQDSKALVSSGIKQRMREEYADKIAEVLPFANVLESTPFAHYKLYEHALNISLMVFDFSTAKIIYGGSGDSPPDRLVCMAYIEKTSGQLGHYHSVNPSQIGALWKKRNFCWKCKQGYQDLSHRCITKCLACRSTSCAARDRPFNEANTKCRDCGLFYFDECMPEHRCGDSVRCARCLSVYKVSKNSNKRHVCFRRKCNNCKNMVSTQYDHLCYHTPVPKEKIKKAVEQFIFYDFECFVNPNGEHVPALVIAMYDSCDDVYQFRTVPEFVDWVLDHRKVTVVAHNGGKYDMHFVKKELIERRIQTSDIVKGNNIFYSEIEAIGIRFIDSLRFLPASIRSFPKMFGLPDITKGYFPYTFYTEANANYIGPMPAERHFNFGHLSKKEKVAAQCWYEEHKDEIIDLDAVCREYCVDDVRILKKGCLMFREQMMKCTGGIDPFSFITIASACIHIFNVLYLKPRTIAVLNLEEGVNAHEEKLEFEHCVRLLPHKFSKDLRYMRCSTVGCSDCFTPHTRDIATGEFMIEKKRKFNYSSIMRQCEWSMKKIVDKEIHEAVKSCDMSTAQINPRDGFYGGRTEVFKTYRQSGVGRIHYFDINSLYPSVQFGVFRGMTKETYHEKRSIFYPTGHPHIIFAPETLEGLFGFAKVKVIPPKGLYIPLLPEKRDGKLMFDLKPKIGTWTTVEIEKAVELGYVIDRIFWAYHFEQRSDTLFRDYVRHFLKQKQEAKGWRKLNCVTEEEKREYIRSYKENQDVLLDYGAIQEEYNAGKYATAKLCLNSHWGKYSQRALYDNTEDTFDDKDFALIVHHPSHDVKNVVLHDNRARTVTYSKKKPCVTSNPKTNIAIAAFTTSYARLRLYEALEILGEKVLYCDTDSVIFYSEQEEPEIYCGEFLGDFSSELASDDFITDFVATAPKSYAYKTKNGDDCCKVKGFKLDADAVRHINFDIMKKMVTEDESVEVYTKPLLFDISKDHSISTRNWDKDDKSMVGQKKKGKKFSFSFTKRRKCEGEGFDTLPFE